MSTKQIFKNRAREAVERAIRASKKERYSFVDEPLNEHTQRELMRLREYGHRYRPEVVILVGIGGSYLGAQALYTLARQCGTSLAAELLCVTGIDATSCHSAYAQARQIILSGRSVLIAVVTKTGLTFETALHAHELYLLALQQGMKHRVIVITDTGSPLDTQAKSAGLMVATLNPTLGGRYSVLSVAGCGVLELCGIDTDPLRQAAAQITWDHAQDGTVFWWSSWLAGSKVYDTFTFLPAYEQLGQWVRQLIGESLGKEGRGFLPTVSVGSNDLHSVVQYYLGGPSLVATQFIVPDTYISQVHSGKSFFRDTAGLPEQLTLDILHKSIIDGVLQAYQDAHRPHIAYRFSPGNLAQVAAWMQERMYETVLLGACMDVNPFDQPQVQLYKERTRKLWN